MVIELIGIRILAPWFGNSIYTWTCLIGVVLISLSFGYYFGGWIADRRKKVSFLFVITTMASFSILIIPNIKQLLSSNIIFSGVIIGPLISSFCIFSIPSFFLAAATPYLIRLISQMYMDNRIGTSAGLISMSSTIGSVAGTFLTGFVLIPNMNIIYILYAISFLLFLLSSLGMIYYKENGRQYLSHIIRNIVIYIIVFSISLLFTNESHANNVIFKKTTYYHEITVIEEKTSSNELFRQLFLDTTSEGAQVSNSNYLPIEYQQYWRLSKILLDTIDNSLFIGGGAFGMPIFLSKEYPDAKIDVIEIDPEVILVGKKFFYIGKFQNIKCVSGDARNYLLNTTKKYDFIFGDAYNGIKNIPFHLVSYEFFKLIRHRMSQNGVYLMNIISSIEGSNSSLFKSLYKTLSKVFPYIKVYTVSLNDKFMTQNLIIAASPKALNYQSLTLKPNDKILKKIIETEISKVKITIADDIPIFTDNYNPVEYIVSQID